MTNSIKEYKKVQFAGNFVKTCKAEKYLTDDSHFGIDYKQLGPRGQTNIVKAYAAVKRMFVHTANVLLPERL